MQSDDEYTNPMVLLDSLRAAKGTRDVSRNIALAPLFMTGDWVASPTGVEGYVAGRSLETPGAWVFVMKTGPSAWDGAVIEIMPEHFTGFRLKEKK